jgi:hypothetical protein
MTTVHRCTKGHLGFERPVSDDIATAISGGVGGGEDRGDWAVVRLTMLFVVACNHSSLCS